MKPSLSLLSVSGSSWGVTQSSAVSKARGTAPTSVGLADPPSAGPWYPPQLQAPVDTPATSDSSQHGNTHNNRARDSRALGVRWDYCRLAFYSTTSLRCAGLTQMFSAHFGCVASGLVAVGGSEQRERV